MVSSSSAKFFTRRQILQTAGMFAGGSLLTQALPRSLAAAFPQQPAAAPDTIVTARARFGSTPIEPTKLADTLTLLTGPGGNVIVSNGPDGKLLVDTFTQLAWDRFKKTLDDMGKAPLKFAIDTHWHWDHTDNNINVHAAGATLISQENTRKRLTESHLLDVLNLQLDPSPADALPAHTFKQSYQMHFNGEHLTLGHMAPAHTDSDIYVHFQKANVLHMGDVFFNGSYCYIDSGTGGSIGGMIAGATRMLAMVDNDTKIVPGHGPLGNKSDLTKFRDMMRTARDRVQKLKAAKKTLAESVAAKPLADLDPVWGKGLMNGDRFVHLIYTTL
ncbi:MAG: MBL fold metallo-hydrolase [Acidobacteriia bacterium]|nr:MBL fold metallo-hydrolase [Terriglobia bacterium]